MGTPAFQGALCTYRKLPCWGHSFAELDVRVTLQFEKYCLETPASPHDPTEQLQAISSDSLNSQARHDPVSNEYRRQDGQLAHMVASNA